jgi:hypothetical protein
LDRKGKLERRGDDSWIHLYLNRELRIEEFRLMVAAEEDEGLERALGVSAKTKTPRGLENNPDSPGCSEAELNEGSAEFLGDWLEAG